MRWVGICHNRLGLNFPEPEFTDATQGATALQVMLESGCLRESSGVANSGRTPPWSPRLPMLGRRASRLSNASYMLSMTCSCGQCCAGFGCSPCLVLCMQAKPKPPGSPEEERTQHGGVAASPFAAGETPSEQARGKFRMRRRLTGWISQNHEPGKAQSCCRSRCPCWQIIDLQQPYVHVQNI